MGIGVDIIEEMKKEYESVWPDLEKEYARLERFNVKPANIIKRMKEIEDIGVMLGHDQRLPPSIS